jgi:hypothetical protein
MLHGSRKARWMTDEVNCCDEHVTMEGSTCSIYPLSPIFPAAQLLGKRLNNYVLFTNGVQCFEFYMA